MSEVPEVPKRRGGIVAVIVVAAAAGAALSAYLLLDGGNPTTGAIERDSLAAPDGGLEPPGEHTAVDGAPLHSGQPHATADLQQGDPSPTPPAGSHAVHAGSKLAKETDTTSARAEGDGKSPPASQSKAPTASVASAADRSPSSEQASTKTEAISPTPTRSTDESEADEHAHHHAGAAPEYVPPVDKSTIPKDGWVGLDRVVVWDMPSDPKHPNYNADNAPNEHPDDGAGAFRTLCRFSHMLFDDPIVYPRQPGKSHLHVFYGNTGADAASTVKSIAGSGRSTCRGGTMNLTSYWVPAMVEEDTGKVIHPPDLQVYYKSGYLGVKPAEIKPMPNGLRMIAGGYMDGRVGKAIVRFECKGRPATRARTIPACKPGETLHIALDFPQCWDGKNLDSPDHRSHVIHATGRGCPATHPVPIPVITYNLDYKVGPGGSGKWRLVSDMYDPAKPPGLSMHGDWFMGWDETFRDEWLENCVKPGRDCHGHLVGPFRKTGF